MFLESPTDHPIQEGSIEVICGSMFSGKTEELLRRLKRARYAKLNIKIFKPKIDSRYDKEKVVSHDENFIDSIAVDCANDILSFVIMKMLLLLMKPSFLMMNFISFVISLQ